jgi:hypothetical protein
MENEKLMLQSCMGIKALDTLFVMYVPGRKSEAQRFVRAASDLGVSVTSAAIAETTQKEDELPDRVLEGFSSASVILLVVSPIHNQIFGHHPVKDQAVERGARIGFVTIPIGEFDPGKIERIAHVSRTMGQMLSEAREAHLTSAVETDVHLDLTGRDAVVFTNFLQEPGAWGALPDYAETAIPPVEGSLTARLLESDSSLSQSGSISKTGRLSVSIRRKKPSNLNHSLKEEKEKFMEWLNSAWERTSS